MITSHIGSMGLTGEGKGHVCSRAALLHVHKKCLERFPCAKKLNLAAEGRWCLLSSHQAEK